MTEPEDYSPDLGATPPEFKRWYVFDSYARGAFAGWMPPRWKVIGFDSRKGTPQTASISLGPDSMWRPEVFADRGGADALADRLNAGEEIAL